MSSPLTAILLATAGDSAGSPAAAQPWEGTTLVERLVAQLGQLGAVEAHVITRPRWEPQLQSALSGASVAMHLVACDDLAGDLRAVAAITAAGDGPLVIANADLLTQGEALAGLLADPRIATGVLVTQWRVSRFMAFGAYSRRGLVLNAGSPYHGVRHVSERFLGVLKVAAAHRSQLRDAANELAAVLDGPLPEDWRRASELREREWRLALARRAARDARLAGAEPEHEDQGEELTELTAVDEAELRRRIAAAREDAPALLLHGLVAAEVPVGMGRLRRLFWSRPLSPADLALARSEIGEYDEEKALLNSAVKPNDGFFTTFFVSPYSKYIARWAARRGWTPNAVSSLSMAVGVLAAGAFATGERAGMIAGAVLLQAAFTLDCVDGQLARYTRTFTRLGGWLDSILDRAKEYAAYAGLALGAAQHGDDVWLLAGIALALQTARHAADFTYNTARDEAVRSSMYRPPRKRSRLLDASVAKDEPGARPAVRWLRRIVVFPIGERFAAISLTAALFDARVTFVVLLVAGGVAALYTAIGKLARSLGARRETALRGGASAAAGPLATYRDDGPVALAAGRLARTLRVPPVALAGGAGLALAGAVAFAGSAASWALVGAVVAGIVLTAGASSSRGRRGRLRWVFPPLLRAIEYGALLWIAAVAGAPAHPAVYALLCAIAFRHYDFAYRFARRGAAPPRWLSAIGGGWDGRLIVCASLAAAGAARTGFFAVAAVLAVLSVGEAVASWMSGEAAERSWSPADIGEEAADAA